MTPTQTGLIVAVPAAEPAVGAHRARLDAAAEWGVPAHLTVLYPFLPPDRIDHEVLAALAEIVSTVPRFAMSLTRVAWFGDRVTYLAPEPAEPFRQLTTLVWQRFPETPPYGGEVDDVIPHLTIGHDHPVDVLTEAAEAVATALPLHAPVTAVRLIAGTPGVAPWQTLAEFPLGPDS